MKIEGILENLLGGFLTLRGFAKIGDIAKISIPDRDFQRELIPEHRDELIRFFSERDFLFFPEVVLGVSLVDNNGDDFLEETDSFYKNIQLQEGFKSMKFPDFRLSYTRKGRLTIYLNEDKKIFSRIDGNHRLAAVEEAIKRNPNTSIKDLLCPFSIIIFRNKDEKDKFSKVIFNNINSKAIPVSLEHNIRLIIEDTDNYSDDKLKNDPSFGWEYYFTRKLFNQIDYDYLPYLKDTLSNKESSGILQIVKFLLKEKVLKKNDTEISKLKKAFSEINSLYSDQSLKQAKSIGLLGAFIYYYFKDPGILESFKYWVIENNLILIRDLAPNSFVEIYDKILSSKNRTIFVSMPFREETESHFQTISRVIDEINNEYNLKTKLKLKRVDWFMDGTSYEITSKIFELIDKSGFLIADLTFANPNVYHEVGYLMGRNRAKGRRSYSNFLLILDISNDNNSDISVAFNLRGLKQIRFSNNEDLGRELKKNILKFYNITQRDE